MCVALHKAGVVLLHHDIVYLRVDDIAQAVMQVRSMCGWLDRY